MATAPAMKITPPYTPELLDAARVEVERFLAGRKDAMVQEYGSGWSTIWLALQGVDLASYEHDEGWFEEVDSVLEMLDREGKLQSTASVMRKPAKDLAREKNPHLYQSAFDLILIDCIDEQRIPCLIASKDKVKPDGWLILDDTHWPLLNPAFEIMSGWKYRTFHGYHVRKDGSTHYHHTTVFYREESTWVSGVGKPAW